MCLVGMWLADDLVQDQLRKYLPRIKKSTERESLLYHALVFSIAHNKVNALQALFEFRADLRDLDVGWKATFVEFSEVRSPCFVFCLRSSGRGSLHLQHNHTVGIRRIF